MTFSLKDILGRVVMKRFLVVAAAAALTAAASAACATKKYVQTSVSGVSERVDSLGNALEETQERTRTNDTRIKEVDTAVQAVRATAQQANQSAKQAESLATSVDAKLDALDTAGRRLAYEVVLSDDDVTFEFGRSELSESAKGSLQALMDKLNQNPRNVLIAIEGHTDSTGPKSINEKIGLERAEAVERYLYEQYNIPLPKMDVISYGEDQPAAPNTTSEGRAQNRRVVIKVMG
jgi:outer membrane protein OmpA-like peptidoglycan-associated protein